MSTGVSHASARIRELLGIVWAVGKWRHYLASRHFTIQTDHDSLKNLPNQPSVNRRVWKWVQVLQGYDCDICHIPGKSNPADFLSRRSIRDVRNMVDVRAEEESLVKRLQLGEDTSADEIQRRLDKIFERSRPELAQVVGRTHADRDSLHSLLVARTRVTLAPDLRDAIKQGLRDDTRWVDIITQIESSQTHRVQEGKREYRLTHDMLEMRDTERTDGTRWRLVIPHVPEVKRRIMEELHAVPYSGHLGYQKTLKKVQQSFYYLDHTLDVRDFVLGCSVCQQEKPVHRVPAGLLQPL